VVSKARLYLDAYRNRFISEERLCRYRIKAWKDVLKEVVIDRGALLGSNEYGEMTGLEQGEALDKIDATFALCYDNMIRFRDRRDFTIPIRYGFKNRCARIRRQISMLDDEALGEESEVLE